jgi:hypothetical protein
MDIAVAISCGSGVNHYRRLIDLEKTIERKKFFYEERNSERKEA